ncbi:hypothetical protein Tdes44962_MAKER00555 [Teratosphaeria destructans]|uniref:Uncharacterized protein n=1 Tax=Teratosphaeria destructans TaxID=418781 RepID=A0A9W7SPX6_9PEZI|nr:hypothetical protein Tdes44962_MAKER00555 [Teratosphaeria destructans]
MPTCYPHQVVLPSSLLPHSFETPINDASPHRPSISVSTDTPPPPSPASQLIPPTSVCTATAAKHLLCACTRAEDNGEINDAVTQAIAANSKGRFTYCETAQMISSKKTKNKINRSNSLTNFCLSNTAYHGWCKSDGKKKIPTHKNRTRSKKSRTPSANNESSGAPRNGYYLFATKAWYQDIWVGGDEMHSMCVDEYNAGASVCFNPKIGAYDDVSERDLNTNHC